MKSILSFVQRINLVFIITTIISGFILFAISDDFVLLKVKFKSCPYNHYELKAVPISDGFVLPDSSYLNKIKNYEIYPGGCTITSKSAKYKIVCKKCGFVLEENDLIEYWRRVTDSNVGFEIKLDSLIISVPVIRLINRYNLKLLSYIQIFRDNKVITEGINYQSNSSVESLQKIILEYFEKNHLNFNETTQKDDLDNLKNRADKYFKLEKPNKFYNLTISSTRDTETTDINFSWNLK